MLESISIYRSDKGNEKKKYFFFTLQPFIGFVEGIYLRIDDGDYL